MDKVSVIEDELNTILYAIAQACLNNHLGLFIEERCLLTADGLKSKRFIVIKDELSGKEHAVCKKGA
ncbi:hypothetical protein Ga0466249_002254 [Sporomusaceae bacterium BoRhaA]|uniref:hypothetical protein n=1 Tax=Pelorhabdus rhamnosifermentans TaxID=2772457 RepID=UPI001C062973|nr:hypothetical protein [Pelorhabdus rhamnosifermentans]MBU2701140.1 hypothetical protein [Pelorhabdus rhamnosifermentans]